MDGLDEKIPTWLSLSMWRLGGIVVASTNCIIGSLKDHVLCDVRKKQVEIRHIFSNFSMFFVFQL